jgi:hypothetical protein
VDVPVENRHHDTYTILDSDGEVLWKAQPGPQQALFDLSLSPVDPAQEILFGGARGGGKSEALRAWMTMYIDNPRFRGLILRKTNESLKEFIKEAWVLYKQLGAKKEDRPASFVFPSGAIIYTGHFKDERSLEDYKGNEYHLIAIEEASQISKESLYEALLGSNRSTVIGILPRVLSTTNPDGPGNAWLQRRFVNIYFRGVKLEPKTRFRGEDGKVRVYIPARVYDNVILMERDPGYLKYLQGIQNEALRRAWLDGDWNCHSGLFFPEWRPNGPYAGEPQTANHVVPAHEIPAWCHRWASLDWGYAHHAAGYWAANALDKRVHVYREMVVRNMYAEDLGAEFAKRSKPDLEGLGDGTMVLYLSHDAFSARNAGKTIAEMVKTGIERIIGPGSAYLLGKTEDERKMAEHDESAAAEMFSERFKQQIKGAKIILKRSAQDRVAMASVAREYLKWMSYIDRVEPDMAYAKKLLEQADGYRKYTDYLRKFDEQQDIPPLPKVQIHDCCRVLIETIPMLRPDPNDLEKVRKFHGDGEEIGDDPWDGFGYLLMGATEQQNVVPLGEYVAKEVIRHLGAAENDINLKIQVAAQAANKFNQVKLGSVIPTLTRDSMRQRWQN